MDATQAFRWSLYYRLLASLSFLVGIGIAVAGIWIGLGNVLAELLFGGAESLLQGNVPAPNSPIIAVLGVVAGVLIWQIGKAAAFYKTMVEATRTQLQNDLDHEAMKSDMLEVIDERLSDMHEEVELTRRGVNSLQQDDHADRLMEENTPTRSYQEGADTGGSGGATGGTTAEPNSGGGDPEPNTGTEPPRDRPSDNHSNDGPADPNAFDG